MTQDEFDVIVQKAFDIELEIYPNSKFDTIVLYLNVIEKVLASFHKLKAYAY